MTLDKESKTHFGPMVSGTLYSLPRCLYMEVSIMLFKEQEEKTVGILLRNVTVVI